MGLLPADTDFRMFSYAHQGRWPGVDIAFLLDAAAYHTDRDTTDRIRKGTLQVRYWTDCSTYLCTRFCLVIEFQYSMCRREL